MGEDTCNPEIIFACLEKLVRPLVSVNILCPAQSAALENTLNNELRDSLDEVRRDKNLTVDTACIADSSDFSQDIQWQFVDSMCCLLLRLGDELKDSDLSLSHQKLLKESILWIVMLGVVPNVVKSVGVIVQDKVQFSNLADGLSSTEKYRRLCAVIKVLVTCLQHPGLRSVVLSYLGSILTALCQLAYAPLKKPSNGQNKNEISQELYNMFCNDQIYYQALLNKVVNTVYQPRVIQELMLILGSEKDHAQPLWLRKSCSKLLTQFLLSPGGLSATIRSTMESSLDTGVDWKTVNVLTKIIISPKQHYANICAQLSELLTSSNASKSCSAVSIACVNELLNKDPELAQSVIIDRLLEPLKCLSSDQVESFDEACNVLVSEEKLTLCLEHLHECFAVKTSTLNSSNLPSHLLYPVSHILFYIFENIKESVSHVKSFVADLLFCLLNDCAPSTLTEIIRAIIFKEFSDCIINPGNISFALGSNGGFYVERAKDVEKGVEYSAVEQAGDVLVFLLAKKDLDGTLASKLFLSMLQILSLFGIAPKNLESCDDILGTVEDAIGELVIRSERHVGAVRLLAALAENKNVQKTLSRNPDCIVSFLEILLQKEVQNAALRDRLDHSDEADIVCVALMILEVIISGKTQDVNWDALQTLVPLLEELKKVAVNPELQNLADHIHDSVVNRGVNKLKPTEESFVPVEEKSECDKAFKDSCDPLLPVRGHALVKLTELINSRDRYALAKKDAILCLFQEHLKNEDTFIYLAAVNGMAALTNYFPETVICSLTEEFTLASTAGINDCDKENLTRMKIGEVLLKVIRLLGEMASKYKNQLLNAFLVGVKDADPLVRASSLSNLGETCRVLGFRIGTILQEILSCIRGVVSSDKAVEPRRAAVMVITLLLQGLQKDALEVLSDDILLLYRALKNLYQRETDHPTKLHAQLALEEIDNIARTFLFAESKSTKRISM